MAEGDRFAVAPATKPMHRAEQGIGEGTESKDRVVNVATRPRFEQTREAAGKAATLPRLVETALSACGRVVTGTQSMKTETVKAEKRKLRSSGSCSGSRAGCNGMVRRVPWLRLPGNLCLTLSCVIVWEIKEEARQQLKELAKEQRRNIGPCGLTLCRMV
jgi:hypothetical protein